MKKQRPWLLSLSWLSVQKKTGGNSGRKENPGKKIWVRKFFWRRKIARFGGRMGVMMRKFYLLLMGVLLLCFSACGTDAPNGLAQEIGTLPWDGGDTGQTTGDTPAEAVPDRTLPQGETEKQENEEGQENVEGQEDSQAQNAEGEQGEIAGKPYYGHWKIVEFQAPGITALSTDEMENYMNVELVYSEESFTTDGVSFENPVYVETTVTKEEFADGFNNHVTFESLHISADTVTDVSIGDTSAFGSMFYVVDGNTLYITMDGAFFKAVPSD